MFIHSMEVIIGCVITWHWRAIFFMSQPSLNGFNWIRAVLLFMLLPTIIGINVFLYSDIEILGAHALVNPEIILPVYIEYYFAWCLTFIFWNGPASTWTHRS